jgi:hypothetical protein
MLHSHSLRMSNTNERDECGRMTSCTMGAMAIVGHPDSTRQPVSRRRNVIVEALAEKYQKTQVLHMDLQREYSMLVERMEAVKHRMRSVEGDLNALNGAIRELERSSSPEPQRLSIDEDERWRREQRRFSQANGTSPAIDVLGETGQQKQWVINEVRLILETLGSMHLRDIHGMLRTKDGDVPSPSRLSQILSESEFFQADRTKGWSLKEERPGLAGPGLAISKTTPSGDGS